MKRIVTAILAAIEAFAIATAGLAFIAVPVLIIWLASYGLQGEPGFVFGLIADLWFFGHGVPLGIELDPLTAASLGLPPAAISATFSLFPLGFMLFTAFSAARMGKRFSLLSLDIAVWGGAISVITIALLAWALAMVAPRLPLQYDVFGSMMMPTVVFLAGLLFGFLQASIRNDVEWFSRARERALRTLSSAWSWLIESIVIGLRVSAYTLVGLLAAGALVFAIRLTVNYVDVVSVSQQLQVDWVGIIALFLLNLAYLPTLLLWTVSWIIGPGFSIGAGTSVSALSTQLGPIPSVPIFGILPTGDHSWGIAIVNLVLLVAVIATFGVLRDEQLAGGERPTLRSFAVIALVAAVSSGLVLAFAMWLATGSLGPGRLEIAGPHPWAVAGIGSAEILVGVIFGAWLRTVDWNHLAAATRERAEPLRESKVLGWMTSRSPRTPQPAATEERSDSGENPVHDDSNDTAELSDFTPWWSEKDDKL